MLVKEIMNKPAVTCPVDSTLDVAARLMAEFDCGIIPVIGDDGRLAGVVTDRDICMAAYAQERPLSKIPVPKAMTRHVIASHMNDAIETVEHLMADNRIRRVPVVDDHGRPLGVVSVNDVVRLAAKSHRIGIDRELVETLAAICQPKAAPGQTPRQPTRPEKLVIRG